MGLKLNIEKRFFGDTETECLGLWVIKDIGIPLVSKV